MKKYFFQKTPNFYEKFNNVLIFFIPNSSFKLKISHFISLSWKFISFSNFNFIKKLTFFGKNFF
ncbi:MAG: hypothetical protein B6I24_01780 [Bacteroidetes bacterium 4572_128]|nr:MAG: hypothetical protein B6I24_01780 [Bacteroidetes bacterium 4572_128]